MKTRRHHNNDGCLQIKRGRTHDEAARLAKRYNVPLKIGSMLKRFGNGQIVAVQPGGICYVLECSEAPDLVFAPTHASSREEGE